MATPEPLRKIKTQAEFAKEFEVSEHTLSKWKQRADFWEEVEKEWNRWGREKTSNVIASFYRKVMQENATTDYKLWFQYFLGWSEKVRGEIGGELKIIHEYVEPDKSKTQSEDIPVPEDNEEAD